MKKRVWIVVLGLAVLTGMVRAAPVIPGLLNNVLRPGAEDVSFAGLPVEDAPLNQVWQLFLPWSKDGLGGGDKYLGMLEIDMPVPGGATPPDLVVVGPGPTVAVAGVRQFGGIHDHFGEVWCSSGAGFRVLSPLGNDKVRSYTGVVFDA